MTWLAKDSFKIYGKIESHEHSSQRIYQDEPHYMLTQDVEQPEQGIP